ncbi:hypothetical protein M231_00308 [Tremella mesenterica]|uniref:Polysaccharide lyase 14 domain-containing protein n=1 Tax=Tremella mesenterica TaxID=5217 RepID=A0A4Q1BW14_TREME|nr:hypothetical protein M231_00308 [Tremella mesenterica]
MSFTLSKRSIVLLLLARVVVGDTLLNIVSNHGLTAGNFVFPVPGTTLNSDAASQYIVQNWDLSASHLDFGANNVVFSPDPSTATSTLVRRARSATSSPAISTAITSPALTDLVGEPPVLRVEYPQGSFSKSTGGTQFYSQPLAGSAAGVSLDNTTSTGQYERMLVAYDIWFPQGYAWNMGGKLPGLRAGPESAGCSGGSETNGTECFSTRIMWRANGAGEVYGYVPTDQKNFCSQSNVICNSDFGTSFGRGTFTFVTGAWQSIWLMVILNEVGVANGVVELWYNGVPALSFTSLELRSASSISSIGGVFFSTFFGGDDSSWASPTDQYVYYRNLQLFAGYGASNGTESNVSSSSHTLSFPSFTFMVFGMISVLGLFLF